MMKRDGSTEAGLTTSERAEIRRLRRQIKPLRTERDILAKATAWFARQTDSIPKEPSKMNVRKYQVKPVHQTGVTPE